MKSRTVRIVIPLVLFFASLLLMMPRSERFGYEYRQGSAWKYETLVSQFSFPILKTPDQILEESQNSSVKVVPYYRQDESVLANALAAVPVLSSDGPEDFSAVTAEIISRIYGTGVVGEDGVRQSPGAESDIIYVQRGKRASMVPVTEVLKPSQAREMLLAKASERVPGVNADSIYRACGLYNALLPDLVFDSEMTRLVASDKSVSISPTLGYVPAGQPIVSEGEIVTAEIEQLLDSYRHEFETNFGTDQSALVRWIGNAGISLAMVVLLLLALLASYPSIFDKMNEYLYLLLILLLMSAGALVTDRMNEDFLFLIPFTLGALFLQANFHKKVAFCIYPIGLLPLLFVSGNGTVLFVMNFVAGEVSIQLFKTFSRRWKQFILAFITASILIAVFLSFRLVHLTSESIWRSMLMIFIASMLTVAGYPLTFLFERLFNLLSDARLEELCSTSNKILLELEQKAPGTFQHSLQVMNMADTAARSIGANPLLVRAGALYHDIGKMRNPLCFIENESMLLGANAPEGYHSGLSPLQSSHDITRHVSDGLELADHYRLPGFIKDFIASHHGTTITSYFFNKHLKEGGDPEDEDQFRYQGFRPRTREQVILMVADSIEAASRTLKNYSSQSLSSLVERIVDSKLEEGQFDDSPITLREITLMKESLKSYLGQMFHERIAYPKKSSTK